MGTRDAPLPGHEMCGGVCGALSAKVSSGGLGGVARKGHNVARIMGQGPARRTLEAKHVGIGRTFSFNGWTIDRNPEMADIVRDD